MVFHIYPFLHLFVKGGFIYLWGIMGAIWALIIGLAVHGLLSFIGRARGGR